MHSLDGEDGRAVTLVEGRVVVSRPAQERYSLTLGHLDGKTQAQARGPSRDVLLQLCAQMEALDYQFIRLERELDSLPAS